MCAQEDDVDRLLTLGIAGGWIVYFIQMAVVASQVFEVRVLIAYLTKLQGNLGPRWHSRFG